MSETTGDIQDHIRDTREDLKANLNELEQKVKSAADWRQHYEKSPGMFVAAALGSGLLLALVTNRRSPRIVYAPPPAPVDIPAPPKAPNHVDDSIGVIKSALIGLAASHVKDAIAQVLPGFRAQLAEREKSEERPPADPMRRPQGNGEAVHANSTPNVRA